MSATHCEAVAFVNRLCGWSDATIPQVAVPVKRGAELVAGACFHSWHPGQDITITIASLEPAFVTRAVICKVFWYPFVQLGLPRVSAEVEAGNTRCIRLATGMGFAIEGRKRQAGANGCDVLLLGLLRDEFRFIEDLK